MSEIISLSLFLKDLKAGNDYSHNRREYTRLARELLPALVKYAVMVSQLSGPCDHATELAGAITKARDV